MDSVPIDNKLEDRFRSSLRNTGEFTLTIELMPGRGSHGKTQEEILSFTEAAVKGGLIHGASLTDNPGGHPALAPEVLGVEMSRLGMPPIIHLTTKDRNRNQLESLLHGLNRSGLRNLLVLTGDYPRYGFRGYAKPVFDLDSVQTLNLIKMMNLGFVVEKGAPGGGLPLPPSDFTVGCAVSPFKRLEAELMPQYYKLHKKINQGASFVVTQLGFDPEKYREALVYTRQNFPGVPILASVYILNRPVARAMNKGLVPGCVVTDALREECEREAEMPDKGREARLLRAAKLLAVMRGLGYDGAHLGGSASRYEDVEFIIKRSEELAGHWQEVWEDVNYSQPGAFYLYPSGQSVATDRHTTRKRPSLAYISMRAIHGLAFNREAPLYRLGVWFYERFSDSPLDKLFTMIEYGIKGVTSRCQRCGDCTLAEVAYLCPQSQCPKFQVNGPCGGSQDGWCEVYPGERKCVYVRAYQRLKPGREDCSLKERYTSPRNWALNLTSSWKNFFLGLDHLRGKE